VSPNKNEKTTGFNACGLFSSVFLENTGISCYNICNTLEIQIIVEFLETTYL